MCSSSEHEAVVERRRQSAIPGVLYGVHLHWPTQNRFDKSNNMPSKEAPNTERNDVRTDGYFDSPIGCNLQTRRRFVNCVNGSAARIRVEEAASQSPQDPELGQGGVRKALRSTHHFENKIIVGNKNPPSSCIKSPPIFPYYVDCRLDDVGEEFGTTHQTWNDADCARSHNFLCQMRCASSRTGER